MKTVLVLSVLLCVAFAAPTEDKVEVPEVVMEAPVKETAVEAEPVSENQEGDTPESRNSCPQGWHSFDTRCFKIINRPSSWYKAMEHCVILGGHLASVHSSREYDFLQIITNGQSSHAWLGGFSLQNQWLWIDGQGFYHIEWDGSYNSGSYPSSSYPCMFLQTSYGWGRSTCSSSRPFICSKSAFSC